MSTITRDQLRERAREKVKSLEFAVTQTAFADSRAELEEELELARIALASLEAEPVGFIARHKETGKFGSYLHPKADWFKNGEYEVLNAYSTPPAPVSVPDEVTAEDCPAFVKYDITEVDEAWARGFNQCRAAMLHGAEPVTTANKLPTESAREKSLAIQLLSVIKDLGLPENCPFVDVLNEIYRLQSNSPVIPDGWVACSDKNPEKGRWLALFGKRTKENCDPYVDEGYLGSDGEFYFFDWESGPRIDDCHPYDKAIVSHWMYWELPAAPKREDL